ncbi:type I restriction enzyme HsdR N-terminal domain-containing protein [Capnocytophaga sp. G2]|jgi:type I restriction enzyme R protein N terminal domain protein|uniref:type I restriction enzyme HsdR N-terminal domain-containing protein n=1 Tax=Capnocytophaga sp. G2 TaxID=3110695 RepID=UPI002B467CA7|nr:type I restriction enzyme HsdR N-terminal domain-containing protein [Capnocytophaga sp. G2]MEB3004725.1 type I restriction enzyme HsdR N-terminal domain-containing protein [Capnocytophaga sp. G2]
MQALNFPIYEFRFKSNENKSYIFDVIRKKFVVLTPEEWVRQHVIHFLLEEKKYPKSLMNVERRIQVNHLIKRYDIVLYRSDGSIFLVVECKAPHVEITQEVFDQIARYNMTLKAENLMITNGLKHIFYQINGEKKAYIFLKELPDFYL